jgi:hypothetical protein
MAHRLVEALNAEILRTVLDESSPVEDIVDELFSRGAALSTTRHPQTYESWADFVDKHRATKSPLFELEGASDISDKKVAILRNCPMAEEMKKLNVDGAPPKFHAKIVEGYKAQNPGSNAILHPGCIAHQVGRQVTVKTISIKGIKNLNFYQIACRSGATGKVVYDENGLTATGMTHTEADGLINGFACLFSLVATEQDEG